MDWITQLQGKNDLEFFTLMKHYLVVTEQGVEQSPLNDITIECRNYGKGYLGNQLIAPGCHGNTKEVITNGYESLQRKPKVKLETHDYHSNDDDYVEGSFYSNIYAEFNVDEGDEGDVAPSRRSTPSDHSGSQTFMLPRRLAEVDSGILYSGAAVLPGSRDKQGGAVVVIYTKETIWRSPDFTSEDLGQLLLYYQTVPRSDVGVHGLTILVNAIGITIQVLNNLLEALYYVQGHNPGAISIVHVLTDKKAQSLLFKSPVFKPQVNLKIDLLTSIDKLYRFVSKSQLPPEMGGQFSHNHNEWVTFRMRLEPFLENCRSVARFLVHVMQSITSDNSLPMTTEEAQTMLERHMKYVKTSLEHPQLVALQSEGDDLLKYTEFDISLTKTEDFKDAINNAKSMYKEVQDTMYKLVKLADKRRDRLDLCLSLREFEEHSSQVLSWLCNEGEEILAKHGVVSDNLKGIKHQQREFDKLYFSAMTHIEKASDLLEEASMLSQSGNLDEASGLKDVAKTLKTHMNDFTNRLEGTREKIDDTAKCYCLLDKSYEWALDTMKYMSRMKMESCTTTEEMDKMLQNIDFYTQQHPPVSPEDFSSLIDLSHKTNNEKLQEQCRLAKSRCEDTDKLLKLRRVTLEKAKDKLITENVSKRRSISSISEESVSSDFMSQLARDQCSVSPRVTRRHNVNTNKENRRSLDLRDHNNRRSLDLRVVPCVGTPPSTVTFDPDHRRRSFAGTASSPTYSPAAQAFKDKDQGYYEENLVGGAITEDLSHRIVTSIPKTLSDSNSKLRASNESLRGSTENLTDQNKNISHSHVHLRSESEQINSASQKSRLPQPPRVFRKSYSSGVMDPVVIEAAQREVRSQDNQQNSLASRRQGVRTWSLVTGSTESLPSLTEEDETAGDTLPRNKNKTNNQREQEQHPEHQDVIDRRKAFCAWSPVPVNSHLVRQNRPTLTHSASMADLRLTDDEIKRRRTLSLIMREMIQTEQDYVRSLQFVIDNYIPELAREDVPQALRGKRNVIFGNIEKLYQFHAHYFLHEIQNCEHNPFAVCHSFLEHEHEFYMYAMYNKNKPKSDNLMEEYAKGLFRQKQIELGDKMDLQSYLLKPVQRMGKYALLLRQLLKECPETDPEFSDLRAAEEMVKYLLRHGNDLLAMDSLRECDVNLQEYGRLLRQDQFLVWQGRKKSLRRVFLFEDLMLFSKAKRSSSGHDTYQYRHSLKTSDIGITESLGEAGHKFEIWFRRRTVGETYILQAPTAEIKAAWVKDISKILWRQAIKNRERRLTEMSSMGVGSKPCIDLKPSADNINDRKFEVNSTSKCRVRNSIAVPSYEHYHKGNKRPISVISLSSTSSSSSGGQNSQSGNSQLGHVTSPSSQYAWSLESQDNQPGGRKSTYTVYSNESGIVPDMGSDANDSSVSNSNSETPSSSETPTSSETPSNDTHKELKIIFRPKIPSNTKRSHRRASSDAIMITNKPHADPMPDRVLVTDV
ncbi:unnamed protein product [Owenia fusiformis]|uniref:Uncharacterized protein n=1 Tax=Owenia fusiformis TaxID=6347 RepID=A0A8J1UR21_OWEFU|nr:unnamed protein product [Owenia fusiformis]